MWNQFSWKGSKTMFLSWPLNAKIQPCFSVFNIDLRYDENAKQLPEQYVSAVAIIPSQLAVFN